jgi:hypothetical protein
MAGLLSNEINNTDDFDLRRRMQTDGNPDPAAGRNRSGLKHSEKTGSMEMRLAICYGLAAIKNGEGAMEIAIKERETGGEFTSSRTL